MNIDWSKAPKGATHAGTTKKLQRPVFYRNISAYGYEFIYADLELTTWMRNIGEPLCLPLIPRDEQPSLPPTEDPELERAIKTVSTLVGDSVYEGDIRMICAAMLDAGYRKFEIVEEDV